MTLQKCWWRADQQSMNRVRHHTKCESRWMDELGLVAPLLQATIDERKMTDFRAFSP